MIRTRGKSLAHQAILYILIHSTVGMGETSRATIDCSHEGIASGTKRNLAISNLCNRSYRIVSSLMYYVVLSSRGCDGWFVISTRERKRHTTNKVTALERRCTGTRYQGPQGEDFEGWGIGINRECRPPLSLSLSEQEVPRDQNRIG